MPRKKSGNGMPPLPEKSRLGTPENTVAALLDILRAFALKNQRPEPQSFYSIREVARHFAATPSTVSRTYQQLEDEGILVSVRGSKTVLQGLSSGRHLSVLGFIGIPAFTPSFVTLQDYRTLVIRTRRELRSRGFAVATVFYNRVHDRADRLVSRIEKYDFDTILWHQPDRAARPIIERLQDSGVQVVAINDRGFPSVRCRYEIRRELAIAAILRDWKMRGGIKSVSVVRGAHDSAAKEELLRSLLEEARLKFQFKSLGNQRHSDFIDSLGQQQDEAIIFPSTAAALFAFRTPGKLACLMSRARVALTGGPVNIPFAEVPDVAADLVLVDWQLVAEQIASNLTSRTAFDHAQTTVFEATIQLRASLSQHSEQL